jgi:hypothetical protein
MGKNAEPCKGTGDSVGRKEETILYGGILMRISVGKLDRFRLFKNGVKDYDELVSELKGEQGDNQYMKIGRAFHKIMECPLECKHNGYYEYDGIRFYNIADYIPREVHSPLWIPEEKMVYRTTACAKEIELVGIADVLYGDIVRDYKTTFKSIDDDKYYNSYQWRYYLWMFEANEFIYDVYQLKGKKGEYDVRRYESFNIPRYPNIGKDCRELLEEFVDFIDANKLEKWMVRHEELL